MKKTLKYLVIMSLVVTAIVIGCSFINNSNIYALSGRATNEWIVALSCADVEWGNAPAPAAQSKYGEPSFTYSDSQTGEFTSSVPTTIGKHYIKAIVLGTSTYTSLSAVISFNITKSTYKNKEIATWATDIEYHKGYTLTDYIDNGLIELQDNYYFKPSSLSKELVIGNNLIDAVYNADVEHYENFEFVTIISTKVSTPVKKDIDTSKLHFTSHSPFTMENNVMVFKYSGSPIVIYLTGLPSDVTIKEYINNSANDIGEFEASAVLEYDEDVYNAPQCPSAKYRIEKGTVTDSLVANITHSIYNKNLILMLAGFDVEIKLASNENYMPYIEITKAGTYNVKYKLVSSMYETYLGSVNIKITESDLGITHNPDADIVVKQDDETSTGTNPIVIAAICVGAAVIIAATIGIIIKKKRS